MPESSHSFLRHGVANNPLGTISLAGTIYRGRGVPRTTMRILGSYALVYLLRGTGTLKVRGGGEFALSPGTAWFVYPEIAHQYGPPPGETWDEMYIVFSGPVFDLWRSQRLLNSQLPPRALGPTAYWRRRIESVFAPADADPLSIICRLQELLGDVIQPGREDADWLLRAKRLMEPAFPIQPPDWAHIADQLDIGYESFRKRFARATGIPPARYVAQRVIDHACRLLHDGKHSNRQIAAECGFTDEFHFARRFKQLVGVTPAAFTQQASGGRRLSR